MKLPVDSYTNLLSKNEVAGHNLSFAVGVERSFVVIGVSVVTTCSYHTSFFFLLSSRDTTRKTYVIFFIHHFTNSVEKAVLAVGQIGAHTWDISLDLEP